MGTDASSNPAGQFALELVEILKRLGAHRRAVHEQTYGNPPWTREQSDAYFYHPLVRACDWLEQRVGISRHDLEHAALRLTTPLGLKGMEPFPNPDGSECDPGMPDWLWMGPKFHECDRDGTTARLWEWLAAEYPAILKEAGVPTEPQPPADKPPSGQKTPKSITKEEAEAVTRRLDKDDVTFLHLRAKDMASRIQQESGKPCSETLVKGLSYWDEAMTATGRGRKRGSKAKGRGSNRGTAARPMSFSKGLEAVTGEGQKHEVLEELVEAEENADAERALREQKQAILRVERSRLSREE